MKIPETVIAIAQYLMTEINNRVTLDRMSGGLVLVGLITRSSHIHS